MGETGILIPEIREIFSVNDLIEKSLRYIGKRIEASEAALKIPGELGSSGFYRRGHLDLFPDPSLLPDVAEGVTLNLTFGGVALGDLIVPSHVADRCAEIQQLVELYLHRHLVEKQIEETIGKRLVIEGRAPQIIDVCLKVEKYAPLDAPILITGNDGVGKDVLAKMIHARSRQNGLPFVHFIGSSYQSGTDAMKDLFGYSTEEGNDVEGALIRPRGGTLFIEDIHALPPDTQSALIRAFEEDRVRPVGSGAVIPVRGRLISSAPAELAEMAKEGAFHRDLYYHISTFHIHLPDLKEHKEDIPLIAEQVLNHFSKTNNIPYKRLTETARETLKAYSFPGNLKELQVICKRALVHSTGKEIVPEDLDLPSEENHLGDEDRYRLMTEEGVDFWEAVKRPYLQRRLNKEELWRIVRRGLKETGGTYRSLIDHFNMDPGDYKKFVSFLNRNK